LFCWYKYTNILIQKLNILTPCNKLFKYPNKHQKKVINKLSTRRWGRGGVGIKPDTAGQWQFQGSFGGSFNGGSFVVIKKIRWQKNSTTLLSNKN